MGRDREPGFEEALYQHLQAAPWWLASMGIHVAGFLLLGALMGGDPALAVERAIEGGIAEPVVDLDPEIEPDVLRPKPIDEPLDRLDPPDPVIREVETDIAPIEPGPETGDPRLPPGPFEGMGNNVHIGTGP